MASEKTSPDFHDQRARLDAFLSDHQKAEARAREWLVSHGAGCYGRIEVDGETERSLADLLLSVQKETQRENAGLELKALERGDHFKAKLADHNAEVKRVVEAVRGDGAQDDTGRAVELACDEILRRLGMEK